MSQKFLIALSSLAVFGVILFAISSYLPGVIRGPAAPGDVPGISTPPPTPNLPTDDVSNLIRVFTPAANDIVDSPLEITGEARGTWYFEALFPVQLLDARGNVLAQGKAQAQGNWMTENFVPFRALLTFTSPGDGATGVLALKKDNPSGLPQNDNERRVPVRFELPSASGGDGEKMSACRRTGCSGQFCSDQDLTTTCEWQPSYACYTTAKCERQANGKCGWTPTAELEACLETAPFPG